jgi:hypothetical protein
LGIYDKKIDLGLNVDFGIIKIAVLGIIVLLALLLLGQIAIDLLKPNALSLSFSENPLDLTADNAKSSILTVRVTNVLQSDAEGVSVEVKPVVENALIVFCSNTKLGKIETGSFREMSCVVRKNPSAQIEKGTYKIVAKTELNSEKFQKEAVLEIRI